MNLSPTPSITPSNTPTNSPTSSNCPTPSVTASQTSTPTPTYTSTPTMTSTVTSTPTNTQTTTPTKTPTQTSTPTQTTTQTPTNTRTPNATSTSTPTQTTTPTPTATFCFEPQAYMVLDAASGSTALSDWMVAQGAGIFRGLNIGTLPSNTLSVYQHQMNAYLSYTGWGVTTFYIEQEPILSTTGFSHIPEQVWSGTNVWTTWFVPTCPFCDNGSWTTWNGIPVSTLQLNKVFYYSGTSIPQGYYRWMTTYLAANQRSNTTILFQDLGDLVCPPTPTPTATNTPTPSVTPTLTPTPTCGTFTTQYLQVTLQACHNFQLKLFDNPDFTGNANAVCNYVVSGCAYGDQGTIYCGTETIASGDHTHNFSLQPVLQPGECVSAFTVNSITYACPCVNVIYQVPVTPTPTTTPTPSVTPTLTQTPTQSPVGPVLWNTDSVNWENENRLWNTI